ncbi:MAG: hypothetical protein QOK66_06790 [Nitrososphaeraceae archaeon]|nr:hypothetical protein [Nitrososphaeraceae archaeon]
MTWSCPICGDQLIKVDEREGEDNKFGFVSDDDDDTPTLVCRQCNIYFTFDILKSIINGQ